MTRTTTNANTTAKSPQTTPQTKAAEEGLLDARVRKLNPARWPTWARARYGVDTPADEVAEPLTVDEVHGD